MELSPSTLDRILSPLAAHAPDLKEAPSCDKPWSLSSNNPTTRIDSLDGLVDPTWKIDGGELDRKQLWAIPSFARGRPPRRIDVYVGDWPEWLQLDSLTLSTKEIGQSDLAKHVLRCLEYWSARMVNFDQQYMSMPFGSQIEISSLRTHVHDVQIDLVPDYDLERQWLTFEELQTLWRLSGDAWPERIDLEDLQFQRQLRDSIGLVTISTRSGKRLVVFKSTIFSAKAMYVELRELLTLTPNRLILPKPLFVVTKKVRFGGKRGVCGFILEYLPLGSLQDALAYPSRLVDLSQDRKLIVAKRIAGALLHTSTGPLGSYTDLKLDNVLLTGHSNDFHAVLSDFEQRTPWHNWAPPECNYVRWIEILAIADIEVVGREEYAQLMRLLLPNWILPERSQRYDSEIRTYRNTAWEVLGPSEREAAMVFMLGKLLWCIFEEAPAIKEPLAIESFHASEGCPVFPDFKFTPCELRKCIVRATAGAPEHEDVRQPFFIHQGRVWPRNKGHTCEITHRTAFETQQAAKRWWKDQIEMARAYVLGRAGMQQSELYDKVTDQSRKRPRLQEVLSMLEAFQSRGSVVEK